MIPLILLTHGGLCDSIYRTAALLFGEQPNVHLISSANLAPKEISNRIGKIIDLPECREHGVLIAVDLKGGSTWNVACKSAHENKHVAIISGVNLPMLLSFFNRRESGNLNEVVDSLIDAGKRGIDKYMC
ncbi:MAG: hypothetical protein V3U73_12920 [bacterium]|jgi:PTS system mannose-specific IIA component/PTS system mannose-specific IIB component